jgi:hypothetical protein
VEKTPNADEDVSSYSKFNENEDHSGDKQSSWILSKK